MVREADGWFWVIPLSRTKASVGWVTDIDTFRAEKKKPADLLAERIAEQPAVNSVLINAERITPVYASSDYSFRNRSFSGKRWLLAGDAAGFIDPVFSSGVFLALFSAESAADALNTALRNPTRAHRAFRSYEKNLRRVMDLYYTFVRGWYRQEFIETILNPTEFFQIVPAVNSVLAGNPGRDFSLLWRLWIFRMIVALQRRFPISPRLDLVPPTRRASATGA
jgi:flavin-dependent dehydrogenase